MNIGIKVALIFPRLSQRDICRYYYLASYIKSCGGFFYCIEITNKPKPAYKHTESASINAPFRVKTLFPNTSDSDINPKHLKNNIFGLLDEFLPDYIIITGYSDRESLISLEWCLLNNVRAVLASCSTKNDTNRIFIKEFFKKIIVSCFHGAFVGGDNSKNYALSLGIPKKEIVTGLQCVDNNWFIKPKFNNKSKKVTLEKTKKILFVGRLIPKKNLERIIDAVYEIETLVKKIKYCIIIVGAGPLESNLKQKVATYKIENRVEFAGWVPKVRIREYYSKADLLILPSYSEPWGLVVNEAMASGLPVAVSNKCGCASDLVMHNNGWVFDPHDFLSIKKMLLEIIFSPNDVLEALGKNSYKIISRWHPENFGKKCFEYLLHDIKTHKKVEKQRIKLIFLKIVNSIFEKYR